MARLIIRNIGAIRNVEIELNRFNVFIGPQSSGKSTIAKIISFCLWLEKNSVLSSREGDFKAQFMAFHNIDENYFSEDSFIQYTSQCCHIEAHGVDLDASVNITLDNDKNCIFRNRKISYIPAERNFVAALPNLGKYTGDNNNITNFLYDWYKAKLQYSEKSVFEFPITIDNNVSYHYSKDKDIDNIVLGNAQSIKLQHSSSGIQSIIPLLVVCDYALNAVYEEERVQSPFEVLHFEEKAKLLQNDALYKILALMEQQQKILEKLKDKQDQFSKNIIDAITQQQEEIANVLGLYSRYHYTQLIIEEPEQNLFPETQRDLVYHLLRLMQNGRENELVITTHSPYILYALNNCMMGYLVKDNIAEESLLCKDSMVDPNMVSIWEINNGELVQIQDANTKTLGKHYFNRNMNSIMNEYYTMLKYLKL